MAISPQFAMKHWGILPLNLLCYKRVVWGLGLTLTATWENVFPHEMYLLYVKEASEHKSVALCAEFLEW